MFPVHQFDLHPHQRNEMQSAPQYYHGNYFAPPGAYPVHYIPPPPLHMTKVPHYEYDKNMGGYYHCCGCPKKPCNRKGGKIVKIEEANPHLESEVDESLVPFDSKNCSDPLVWHSPSGNKAQMSKRTNDIQYERQEEHLNHQAF